MSSTDETVAHLCRHARGSTSADDATLLADYAWMVTHGGKTASVEPIWADIARTFEQLNADWRQVVTDDRLPRKAVYAVSGMVSHCFDVMSKQRIDPDVRQQFFELGWNISCAWEAVLAGDIEDIAGHVDLERSAGMPGFEW